MAVSQAGQKLQAAHTHIRLVQAVAIMNKLAAELDIHKAIDSIRSFILELLACESVTLFLVDSENKSVRQAKLLQVDLSPFKYFSLLKSLCLL